MIKCKTCGGLKKDHMMRTWEVHKKMHEHYDKILRERDRYMKLAQKKVTMREAKRILASRAGSTKSEAKSAAARINGRKGGRPRTN